MKNTEMFCTSKMQNFWMYKHVVHVVLVCFKRLIGEARTVCHCYINKALIYEPYYTT